MQISSFLNTCDSCLLRGLLRKALSHRKNASHNTLQGIESHLVRDAAITRWISRLYAHLVQQACDRCASCCRDSLAHFAGLFPMTSCITSCAVFAHDTFRRHGRHEWSLPGHSRRVPVRTWLRNGVDKAFGLLPYAQDGRSRRMCSLRTSENVSLHVVETGWNSPAQDGGEHAAR